MRCRPCGTRAALNHGQRRSHRTGQEAPRSNTRKIQQSPCDTHERERAHGMHRQQTIPAALTHTPRTPPPHACYSCPLTSTACAHAHTHTHTHTAPCLLHASIHTTRAQRLPPGPPAHAMPLLSVGTRPARAQRPSPGARARALRCLPLAECHPALGGGGGGGGTATHCRPLRSCDGRRKGWPPVRCAAPSAAATRPAPPSRPQSPVAAQRTWPRHAHTHVSAPPDPRIRSHRMSASPAARPARPRDASGT
jgi:hypothetical protein